MQFTKKLIRFNIAYRWTVADLANCLIDVNKLYSTYQLLLKMHTAETAKRDRIRLGLIMLMRREAEAAGPFRPRLRKLGAIVGAPVLFGPTTGILTPETLTALGLPTLVDIRVHRLEYGSPGTIDLIGIGEVVGHIKDFIAFIIQHRSERKKRSLMNKRRELLNERLRLENAQRFIHLARECGYATEEFEMLVKWIDSRQQTFIDLVKKRKLSKVQLLSD